MISTIRLVSTTVFIGLSETNTIGYLRRIAEGEKGEDRYAEELSMLLPLETFDVLTLWPTPHFTPEELETIGPEYTDPIEHFMELTKDLLE